MDKEYLEMKKMTYDQLVNYLQTKYGIPQGSYWLTPSCRTKNNKIMRGKEGLYCHHVREDLSNCLCNCNCKPCFLVERRKGYETYPDIRYPQFGREHSGRRVWRVPDILPECM